MGIYSIKHFKFIILETEKLLNWVIYCIIAFIGATILLIYQEVTSSYFSWGNLIVLIFLLGALLLAWLLAVAFSHRIITDEKSERCYRKNCVDRDVKR